jgi:hypothetical protein
LPAKVHSKAVVEMTATQHDLYSQIYAHSKTLWAEKQLKNELIKQGKERDPKNVRAIVFGSLGVWLFVFILYSHFLLFLLLHIPSFVTL